MPLVSEFIHFRSPPARPRSTQRTSRVLAAALLLHFAALCWLKLTAHEPGELVWISHVTLLLAGLALMMQSSRLVALAFVSVAGVHALWVFDAIVGAITGHFPVGVTNYVETCDWATLAATVHHAYLAPVLFWWLWTRGPLAPGDWLRALAGGVGLMTLLCLLSRLVLPAQVNANVAHALFPESTASAFRWYNRLPWWSYLAIHVPVWSVVFILPGALLLRAVDWRRAWSQASGRTRRLA